MRLPKLPQGFKRKWVQCTQCGAVAHYIYQPFSLSNPILTLPCGHGASLRWSEATRTITAKAAMAILANKKKGAVQE